MPIITAANLADWLGISDTLDDTNLSTAVASANAAVVEYCGRDFEKATTATARVFEPRSWRVVDVDDFWTATDLVVEADRADNGGWNETWLAAWYALEPRNGIKNGIAWPYERIRIASTYTWPANAYNTASVRVTAQWGWAAIPDPVFQAALIKAARLFRRKDSPDGLIGGFSDIGPVRVSLREDPDVAALLRPYIRPTSVLIA